jgi:hypothetical protein
MKILAWCSSDGETVEVFTHTGHAGLMAWWRSLPKIVGIKVWFEDGSTHRMEASEYYGLLPRGRERARFWNGDCCAPPTAHVIPGIEVPDKVYLAVDEMMDRA